MIARGYLTCGLIIILLIVLLGFANFYFIQPGLEPQLPEPKKLPLKQTCQAPVDKNIVATTLEKIRTMFPKKELDKGFEPRRVARNPFLWPEEMLEKQYAKADSPNAKKEGEETGLPRLNMILIGENRKIALINNKLVFEGTIFNGDMVHSIKEKEVVLKGDSGETRLSLAKYTFAPAEKEAVSLPQKASSSPAQNETIESLYEKLKPLLDSGLYNESS